MEFATSPSSARRADPAIDRSPKTPQKIGTLQKSFISKRSRKTV